MKIKKKNLYKLILFFICILSVIGIFSTYSYAEDGQGTSIITQIGADALLLALYVGTGGVALILIYVVKLLIVVVGFLLEALVAAVIGGGFGVEGIIFSGVGKYDNILNVNFFDKVGTKGTIGDFCNAVAEWYYILRYISIAALLLILIYIGIRMALSTLGKDKAKYKEWLVNWVVSVALVFLLHYLMIGIFAINNSLVSALYSLKTSETSTVGLMGRMALYMLNPGISGIFAAVVFAILSFQVFSFLFIYVKRLITIYFLAMISPLICITYSIDKLGDGKSQALNAWLKEFAYNVLIQPFHCIIYMSFMTAIFELIAGEIEKGSDFFSAVNVQAYILCIFVLFFMKDAEKLLRQIFHWGGSMPGIGEAGQTMMNATGKFASIGAAASKSVINFRNAGGFQKMRENFNFKSNAQANKQLKDEYKSEHNGSRKGYLKYKTLSDEGRSKLDTYRKENVREKKESLETKKYNKLNNTNFTSFDQVTNDKKIKMAQDQYNKNVENETKRLYDDANGEGSYERYQNTPSNQRNQADINAMRRARRNARSNLTNNGIDPNSIRNSITDDEVKKAVSNDVKFINRNGNTRTIKKAASNVEGTYHNFRSSLKDRGLDKFSSNLVIGGLSTAAGFAVAGAQGNIQGFISGYQATSGFLKPVLDHSSETAVEETAIDLDKLKRLTGQENVSSKVLLDNIKNDKDSGAIEQVHKDIKDLKTTIRDMFGSDNAHEASKVISELQKAVVDKKVKTVDIDKIMRECTIPTTVNRNDLRTTLENLAGNIAHTNLAKQIGTNEKLGFKSSYMTERVEEYEDRINNT